MCVNEFLERSIRRLLPNEFAERKKMFEDEMIDIAGGSAMEDGTGRVSFLTFTVFIPFLNFLFAGHNTHVCLHHELPQHPMSTACF